ncbi:Band 7 protein-like 4 [Homarus americanus]|uniref:Band 7 protein-like 4 n=1 Tax=Homarus americanus TaxID=6706 RepID=A0A8J5TLN9_HOMAM|nr:Band 7 protein-like 4 [Homarus americanus]
MDMRSREGHVSTKEYMEAIRKLRGHSNAPACPRSRLPPLPPAPTPAYPLSVRPWPKADEKNEELRYLQTLNTISAEKNSTIIFPVPIDIIHHYMRK